MAGPSFQALPGFRDFIPRECAIRNYLFETWRSVARRCGYVEYESPVLEDTSLYLKKSGGELSAQLFRFEDQGGRDVTLRPEVTASLARLVAEHQRHFPKPLKWFEIGQCFRYEKPQKGRYRQFHQFDVEALGFPGPDIDAELIIMLARIWRLLRIEHVSLQINTLGTTESRVQYRTDLTAYFRAHFAGLDEDSRRRLERNPLRILDSKNPALQALIADAPRLTGYLDGESEAHFSSLRALLDDAGVPYVVNPRLVRGLDYYGRTVFEWVTDRLGTQGAVCAGGRYDGLVECLGGEPTPAVGFAIGLERLVELYALAGLGAPPRVPDVYVVAVGEAATRCAFRIAESLRDGAAPLRVETNCGGGSFKSQMKRADRSGATVAVLLGEDEVASGTAVVKPLRTEVEQTTVATGGLADAIAAHLRSRP